MTCASLFDCAKLSNSFLLPVPFWPGISSKGSVSSILQTENLINSQGLLLSMTTPMDRGFGDTPFRKMEKAKAAKRTKGYVPCRSNVDIEEPIAGSED